LQLSGNVKLRRRRRGDRFRRRGQVLYRDTGDRFFMKRGAGDRFFMKMFSRSSKAQREDSGRFGGQVLYEDVFSQFYSHS